MLISPSTAVLKEPQSSGFDGSRLQLSLRSPAGFVLGLDCLKTNSLNRTVMLWGPCGNLMGGWVSLTVSLHPPTHTLTFSTLWSRVNWLQRSGGNVWSKHESAPWNPAFIVLAAFLLSLMEKYGRTWRGWCFWCGYCHENWQVSYKLKNITYSILIMSVL